MSESTANPQRIGRRGRRHHLGVAGGWRGGAAVLPRLSGRIAGAQALRRSHAPGRVRRAAGRRAARRKSKTICGSPAACRRNSPHRCANWLATASIPMATLQAITPLLALEPPAISLGRSQQEEEALIVAARLPAAIATIHAALQDHPEHPYPAVASLRRALPATAARPAAIGHRSVGVRKHADPATRSWLQRQHIHRTRRDFDAGAGDFGACRRQWVRSMDHCMAPPISKRWRWRWKSGEPERARGLRRALPRDRTQGDGHGPSRIPRRRSALTDHPGTGATGRQATSST